MPVIRPYRPADQAGVANVCIRTAAAGEDATNDYADPSVLPNIFALPYAYIEPHLAFVVEETAADRAAAEEIAAEAATLSEVEAAEIAAGGLEAGGGAAGGAFAAATAEATRGARIDGAGGSGAGGSAAGGSGAVDGIVGYILGTADSAEFVKRFRDEWLPLVGDRHPEPAGEPGTRDEVMASLLHHPERMLVPALAGWPAHLHIDLLPAYQRRGLGRQLMEEFLSAVRAAGASAVHLGMLSSNVKARAFYDRVGFKVIDVPDAGDLTYLGVHL